MIKFDVGDDHLGIKEWEAAIRGKQTDSSFLNEKRRRIIHRISPLLRANKSNEKEYDPLVVSLGPYHHNKGELQLAEKFKPRALLEYVSGCDGKSIQDLYNKVLEMVDIARSCYVEGSTDDYRDEKFSRMMLLDACFILTIICSEIFQMQYMGNQSPDTEDTETEGEIFQASPDDIIEGLKKVEISRPSPDGIIEDTRIEAEISQPTLDGIIDHTRIDAEISQPSLYDITEDPVVQLYHEHLGALGWANLFRDMFLLENQVPYEVLRVLINFRSDVGNEREETLNSFVDFIVHRQRTSKPEGRTLSTSISQQEPSHLLEMYRTSFLSFDSNQEDLPKAKFRVEVPITNENLSAYYTHSCRSATELKAKGINFRPSTGKSLTDINFNSSGIYGQLEIPSRVIATSAKAIFLNLIAYEMSPHTPNDFSVTSYIQCMKSLITHPDDVKVLRSNHILLDKLNSDEELAKMYMEISIPRVNNAIFMKVQEGIQKHYNSKAKTSISQMISRYLSSPWTAIGLLAATLLLVLTFLQTYFTISPRSS
ncbi:hypothetical protein RJ640_028239 [Escallonia rubra]|uniref:Uncharacterized protein n=1 Tax=Escallonia rubra TaxID=112253 RepID=A0AA88URT6_9ASTE|nr:hypothetical protein RJ640_028239 [Escallonia rubra]